MKLLKQKTFFVCIVILLIVIVIGLIGGHEQRTKSTSFLPDEAKPTEAIAGEVSSPVVSDIARIGGWKTYRNDNWGFSFKYPQGVEVIENDEPYEIHVFIRLDDYLKISSDEKAELKKIYPSNSFAEGAYPRVVTMDIKERVQPNPAHKDVETVMHEEPGDLFGGYEYGPNSKINHNYKIRFHDLPAVRLMINNIYQGLSGTVSYFALHPNNDQLRVEVHQSVPFKDVPENTEFPSWYSYFEKSLPLQDLIMNSIEYFPPKKNIQKAVYQLS